MEQIIFHLDQFIYSPNNRPMKKILFLFAVAAVAVACEKNDPIETGKPDTEEVKDLKVPESFDWKTTSSVACDFTAPHASLVHVATESDAKPFASFLIGGNAEPVSLSIPSSTRTLYVSYVTETDGTSKPQAVPVTNNAANFALTKDSGSKDYTGLDNGDWNDTVGSTIYMPAHLNGWGTIMFEDLWPSYGDYDFNDLVFNYKVQLYMNNKNKIRSMLIGVRVRAVGGSLPYDLYLSLLGVNGGEIDRIEPVSSKNASSECALVALNSANNVKDNAVLKFENIRQNANKPAGSIYLNTEKGYEMADKDLVEVSYLVTFRNEIKLDNLAFDTFDFFIAREQEDGSRMEIHMGGFPATPEGLAYYETSKKESSNINNSVKPYFSNSNLVWGINVPTDISHAYESGNFLKAYPKFKQWVLSGGFENENWYKYNDPSYLIR